MKAEDVVARVRTANVAIAQVARDAEFAESVPFVCECGDPTCQGLARLSADAFDLIASRPAWRLVGDAHGHRAAVVDDAGTVFEFSHLPYLVT
jgi:hypothetical protein